MAEVTAAVNARTWGLLLARYEHLRNLRSEPSDFPTGGPEYLSSPRFPTHVHPMEQAGTLEALVGVLQALPARAPRL